MALRTPEAVVALLHADYTAGLSLAGVARKHGRNRKSVRELFERRGLSIRIDPRGLAPRLANGRVAPLPPITVDDIDAMCADLTRIAVPVPLKPYWRKWPLPLRGVFIECLREKLGSSRSRPTTPFSANVEPFDYASPRAWEIIRRMNAGRDSRTAAAKINIASQGVIWRGQLYFWVADTGYVLGCKWTPESGRPLLHRVIWEDFHGRPVPPGHVVVALDGNENNLAPENLALQSRGDLAVENKQAGRRKREHTANFFRMHAGVAALTNL